MTDAKLMLHLRTQLGKKLHGYPLTQKEMTTYTGYTQDAISKIENGHRYLSGPAKRCLALLAEKHDIEIECESSDKRPTKCPKWGKR